MSSSIEISTRPIDRRKFIGGAAAAAAVGTAVTTVAATPAAAEGGQKTFRVSSAPKPIGFLTPPLGAPEPFNQIHFALPGPPGATTQILQLESFGLDADPSTVGDFEGFVAFAVIAGSATSRDGDRFDCELDVRVMDGRYIGEDGREHKGTFAFFWLDFFLPGQGGPGQVHDFNPGILQNGLFWTMEIPSNTFKVRRRGTWARLRLDNLPMPNTFFFANNVSVAGEIDVDITWRATSDVMSRGKGDTVPADSFESYLGEMRDATCAGTAKARHTGFSARTNRLTEDGYFAQMGHARNGVFL